MRILLMCDFFLKYVIPHSIGLRRSGAEVMIVCRSHARERSERADGLTLPRSRNVDCFRRAGWFSVWL